MVVVLAEIHDFFGDGEDAGLAGDEQEAVMGLAAEPARPVQAAIVERTIETVARQDSVTRRVKPSIAGSWVSAAAPEKKAFRLTVCRRAGYR